MKLALRLLGGALLALVLAGCHAPPDNTGQVSTLQLKLYKVPALESSTIRQALLQVLAGSAAAGHVSMRVTEPFPGTLMVLAPKSLQSSVGSAIAALDKAAAKVAEPGRLQVHFWVIAALPGKGEDSPALQPLAQTLDVLRTSLGPSHFALETTVGEVATFGEHGYVRTGDARLFAFTARPGRNGGIDLEMDYSDKQHRGIGRMQTTVATSPGQYVVLAQAPGSNSSGQSSGKTSSPPALLLLVARVDRIEPGKQ
ncbi:MAG: hypothetical protein ACREPK_10710 [Rhodanobacteraceae bacterium]